MTQFEVWSHYQEIKMLKVFTVAIVFCMLVAIAPRLRRVLLWIGVLTVVCIALSTLIIYPPKLTLGMVIQSPLWYDETFSWAVSRLPWDRALKAIVGDVHPPLWYIVEAVAIRALGESPAALRSPSVLCGALSAILTFHLSYMMDGDRRRALLSIALLSVIPGQLYYVQEARMYALLQAAFMLAVVGIASRRGWMVVAGTACMLYTHNLSVVLVCLLCVFGLIVWPRSVYLALFGSAIWAFCWGMPFIRQVSNVSGGFWILDRSLGGYLMPVLKLAGAGLPDQLSLPFVLIAVSILLLIIYKNAVADGYGALLILMLGFPVSLAIFSEMYQPLYLDRIFIVLLPLAAILTVRALALLCVADRRPVLAALAMALAMSGVIDKGTEQYKRIANDIRSVYRPGEVIYHANLASYILFSYYLGDIPAACYPDAGDMSQALSIETQNALGIMRKDAHEIHGDFLLVWVENPTSTPDEIAAQHAALSLGESRQLMVWRQNDLVNFSLWEVKRGKTH